MSVKVSQNTSSATLCSTSVQGVNKVITRASVIDEISAQKYAEMFAFNHVSMIPIEN